MARVGLSRLAVATILAAIAVGAAADDAARRFEAARALLERREFVAAREALEPLASAGHLQAQSAIAAMVLKGLGGERSVDGAIGWYCRIAQQPAGGREVAHALWFLAEYFRTGGAVPGSGYRDGDPARENPLKALFWYRVMAGQKRYYQQVVSEAVRLGRLGAARVEKQLYASEVEQVTLRLTDWRPDPSLSDPKRCLSLP